jgi:hypothetical protein
VHSSWNGHRGGYRNTSFGFGLFVWPWDYNYYSDSDTVLVSSPNYQPVVDNNTTESSFIVNVPNDKGGYTQVLIKRLRNGYVGPQGEFYYGFPLISQLKFMYGN